MSGLPFLLQGREVPLEGGADLIQELHQGMAEEAGVGRLGVEVVGGGPARRGSPPQMLRGGGGGKGAGSFAGPRFSQNPPPTAELHNKGESFKKKQMFPNSSGNWSAPQVGQCSQEPTAQRERPSRRAKPQMLWIPHRTYLVRVVKNWACFVVSVTTKHAQTLMGHF